MGIANGVLTVSALNDCIDDFDVLVDFTSPSATIEHLACCQNTIRPWLSVLQD